MNLLMLSDFQLRYDIYTIIFKTNIIFFFFIITKTRLFKYIENFTTKKKKKWKLSDEKFW